MTSPSSVDVIYGWSLTTLLSWKGVKGIQCRKIAEGLVALFALLLQPLPAAAVRLLSSSIMFFRSSISNDVRPLEEEEEDLKRLLLFFLFFQAGMAVGVWVGPPFHPRTRPAISQGNCAINILGTNHFKSACHGRMARKYNSECKLDSR